MILIGILLSLARMLGHDPYWHHTISNQNASAKTKRWLFKRSVLGLVSGIVIFITTLSPLLKSLKLEHCYQSISNMYVP